MRGRVTIKVRQPSLGARNDVCTQRPVISCCCGILSLLLLLLQLSLFLFLLLLLCGA